MINILPFGSGIPYQSDRRATATQPQSTFAVEAHKIVIFSGFLQSCGKGGWRRVLMVEPGSGKKVCLDQINPSNFHSGFIC